MSEHLEHISKLLDELSLAQVTLDLDNLLEVSHFLSRLEDLNYPGAAPEVRFVAGRLAEAAVSLIKGALTPEITGELLGQGLSLLQEMAREDSVSDELAERLAAWGQALDQAGNSREEALSPPPPISSPPEGPPPPGGFYPPLEQLGRLIGEFSNLMDKIQVILVNMEHSPDPVNHLPELNRWLQLLAAAAGFLDLRKWHKLTLELWGLVEDVQAEHILYNTQVADLLIEGSSKIAEDVKHLQLENNRIKEGDAGGPPEDFTGLLNRILAFRQGLSLSGRFEDALASEEKAPRKLGEILVEKGAVSPNDLSRLMQAQNENSAKKLGDLLLEAGMIKAGDLEKALEIQRREPGRKVGEILVALSLVDPELIEQLLHNQEANRGTRLGELLVRSKIGRAAEVAEALREQRKAGGQLAGALQMVKVETRKLDALIDLVGELVIAQSLVNPGDLRGGLKDQKLIKNLAQVSRITSELQRNAMGLRMVQVRPTFQKMQRLARDLSRRLDKPVELNLIGADTEIDRNMVETIYDPLVHMIRNAMDHGIEPAEARRAAGKTKAGHLTLRAYHQGGNVIIELTDDGQGLDAEKIMAKALSAGLLEPGEHLGEPALYNLIFHPGFSTSQEVTDISGRGLGMGVVKQAIELLRGKIDLCSAPGKSTTVTIRLPLTLAIIDGMIVRVGENRYILPTVSINESFRPRKDDFFTVKNQGEVIKVRNQMVPLLRLGDVVGDPAAGRDPAQALVVVVENEGQRRCLLVDEVIGKQEVVIKSLGERLKYVKTLAGGTILGDGRVGLILDVAGLFNVSSGTPVEAAGPEPESGRDDDWGMGDPGAGLLSCN